MSEQAKPERRLPLDGVRVLSQSIVWAGPFATLILLDLGAEVIEVESIQHLNPTRTVLRHLPPSFREGNTGAQYVNSDLSEGFWNRQAWFNYGKRGAKSVTFDLRQERGRELFYELAKVSDAFIENNSANVVEHLGIDYDTLSSINPRLIMVRFPGFGISGPDRHFRGYGNIMEALAGHTMVRGYEGADPSMSPVILHGDPNAGAHAALALEMALFARERTGRGQLVDLSQHEAVIQHLAYSFMDYSMNRRVHGHPCNRHPSMAPHGIYRSAGDDEWVALAIGSDEEFAALCEVLGQPALATDVRFADVVVRHRNQRELDPLVEAATAGRDGRELMDALQSRGVHAMRLEHQEEMFEDPHLLARDYFQPLTHPEAGTHQYPGPMTKFARRPLTPLRGPAPCLGEHNREVLQGLLGLGEDDYQQLLDDEIIGTVYTENATG